VNWTTGLIQIFVLYTGLIKERVPCEVGEEDGTYLAAQDAEGLAGLAVAGGAS